MTDHDASRQNMTGRCLTCSTLRYPLTVTVWACPACDLADLFPYVIRTLAHHDGPYDWEKNGI